MSATSKRVVLITGASRGIGRAIALKLARPDTFIYVNYRSNQTEADSVVSKIGSLGFESKAIAFDVANDEAVASALETIASEAGGIDVLVSNAGISIDSLIPRFKTDDFQKLVETNLKGAFLLTRGALKTMLRRKNQGRIVFVTSVVGQMGNGGQSVYAATKSGVRGFMKSIAKEVASREITVNCVAPGFVKTEMTDELTETQKTEIVKKIPMGRVAEPEDVANVVQFIASSAASYITGQEIAVNGGMYL